MLYGQERVSVDPEIMGGVPCIRGTRIPIATIVGLVAKGETIPEIVNDYPWIENDDVKAALIVAAEMITDSTIAKETAYV